MTDTHAEHRVMIDERNASLKALDVPRVIAYHARYNPGRAPLDHASAEIAMHHARTILGVLTDEEREMSERWLVERGHTSLATRMKESIK